MNKAFSSRPFYFAVTAAIALLVIDYQYRLTEPLQYTLNQSLVLPARRVLGLPGNLYRYISENLTTYSRLIRDNQRLKTLNSELQIRLTELDALRLENSEIREALGHSPSETGRFVHTSVVQILFRQNRAILVVDRTAEDGVEIDQAVVDRKGLVGRIISVYENNSHVQMISDNKHYLSAFTEGNEHTIVQGRGVGGDLAARYIPNFAEVSEGEEVYSSGLDGIYPKRFPIGRISSVQLNPASDFSTVFIRPHANLQSNRELYILLDAGQTSGENGDGAGPGNESGEDNEAAKAGESDES